MKKIKWNRLKIKRKNKKNNILFTNIKDVKHDINLQIYYFKFILEFLKTHDLEIDVDESIKYRFTKEEIIRILNFLEFVGKGGS